MTVRGGGVPCHAMAFVPPLRMGPPPRSSPPMRMRASWFGSLRSTGYKVAARVHRALTASSPRTRHPDHNKRANVLEAVKARPGNDRAEASAERRPALTAPARVGFQHEWVGAKKRDSKSNKETGMKKVKNAVK